MTAALGRRTFLRGAGLAALATAGASTLTACSGRGGGSEQIRFSATKRETVKYWNDVVAEYNASQKDYRIRRELSTNLVADFVRDTPVPVGLAGFDIKFGGFVKTGVLADQSKNPALETLRPDAIEFSQQFGTYEDHVSSLPYSIAGQGVIYNRELFDKVGAEVPTTWSQLIEVCELFVAKKITPLMGTFVDQWTMEFALFNHAAGGGLDVPAFFEKLNALGTDTGPDAEVSFSKDFREPLLRAKELLPYFNTDAKNIAYDQGNRNMAEGKAAMLIQGPWAYEGIRTANPDFQGGMFPLPMTDDPDGLFCISNLDLTAFTPASATGARREGGLAFLEYLMQPEVMHRYNTETLAFSTDKNAPPQTNPLVSDLNDYILGGKYVQGASLYIPFAIPKQAYIQEYFYGGDVDAFTSKLDRDWKRLAIRLAA